MSIAKEAMNAAAGVTKDLKSKLHGPQAQKKFQANEAFLKKYPNKGVAEVKHDGPAAAYKNTGA